MVYRVVCWIMIAVLPSSLMASDMGAAMFYVVKGTAFQNGNPVPGSIAIFPGDIVQTQPDSLSKITANGASIMIGEESLIRYQPPLVALEHGVVGIGSQKPIVVRAGDVMITPVSEGPLQFEVSDRDGVVHIVASKGDLKLENCGSRKELKEGYEYTCQERRGPGAMPAGSSRILTGRNLGIAGAAAGVIAVCKMLCKGAPTPASPWQP